MKPEKDPLKALFDGFREDMEPIDPEGKEEAIERFLRARIGVDHDQIKQLAYDMWERRKKELSDKHHEQSQQHKGDPRGS